MSSHADAGIGHQNIKAVFLGEECLSRCGSFSQGREVQRVEEDLSAFAPKAGFCFLDPLLAFLLIARCDVDLAAFGGQVDGVLEPNARGTSGGALATILT
jgi:hypothetical protein